MWKVGLRWGGATQMERTRLISFSGPRNGRIAPRFALPRSCEHSQSAGPLPRFLLMYGGVTKQIARQNARRPPNVAVLMGKNGSLARPA